MAVSPDQVIAKWVKVATAYGLGQALLEIIEATVPDQFIPKKQLRGF